MLIFTRYTWWVGAMIGLAIVLAVGTRTGALTPVQDTFLRATSPLEGGMSALFRPVAGVLADVRDLNSLREENRRLRLENESLRNQLTERELDIARIEELERALGIVQEGSGGTRVFANTVSQDRTAFTDVVSINRGSDDGIRVGNVVTSFEGSLVGTVIQVSPGRALVRLISDSRSKVAAVDAETGADGIVQGSPGGKLTLELAQGTVTVGDTILTSGLGGGFPADIPIGVVSKVSGTPQDLFLKIEVEPRVRLSITSLRNVLVITSFVPQRLGLD